MNTNLNPTPHSIFPGEFSKRQYRERLLSRLSFRSQLTLILFTLALFTVILMSVVAYMQAIQVLKRNSLLNTQTTLQRTRDEMLSKFNTIENTLKLLSTDQRLQNINRNTISNRELTKFFMDCINLNNYQDSFAQQHPIKNLIDELLFIGEQRLILTRRDHFTIYGIENYLPSDLLKQAYQAEGAVIWSPLFFNRTGSRLTANLPAVSSRSELNQMALIKYVAHERSKTTLGYLVASVNLTRISELIEGIPLGKNGRIYLIDEHNRIIASREPEFLLKPLPLTAKSAKALTRSTNLNFETAFDGVPSFIQSVDLGVNHWKLIGVIATGEFATQAALVRNRLLWGGFLGLLCFALGSAWLANRISRPILKICGFLKSVTAGNLTLRTHETGSIEINQLTSHLNQMIESTSQLLEENYREQLFKRKAELKALHAQINPHFLYNTLDSISWMIESGRREVAVGLIQSLSTFFRSSLSGGRDIVTIQEEVTHARSYLEIQKIRYQNRLDYLFDIDETILEAPTVKITLQPLIENAIYHGVKLKTDGPGIICISGMLRDSKTIRLTVTDNGPGIIAEQLTKLNEAFTTPALDVATADKGYSLLNINTRLKLNFGWEYGLHYSSQPGIGTRAEVLLPLEFPNLEKD